MKEQIHFEQLAILYEGAFPQTSPWLISNLKKFGRDLIKGNLGKASIRGPEAVRKYLFAGLKKLNINFKANSLFGSKNPWIGVLSDPVHALPWAIREKERGIASKLIAGPNLVTVPENHEGIIRNPMIDIVVTPCKWVSDVYIYYAPELKNRLVEWAVGVDEIYWAPTMAKKQLDCLIYNKQTNNGNFNILKRITGFLDSRKISYKVLNYNELSHPIYLEFLQNSCAMIYLGQTESQGISLFEAWSCGVPTLVHNHNLWVYKGQQFNASAAPYLSDRSGMSFDNEGDFQDVFDEFFEKLQVFEPREYILENFTLEKAAQKYLDIFLTHQNSFNSQTNFN